MGISIYLTMDKPWLTVVPAVIGAGVTLHLVLLPTAIDGNTQSENTKARQAQSPGVLPTIQTLDD